MYEGAQLATRALPPQAGATVHTTLPDQCPAVRKGTVRLTNQVLLRTYKAASAARQT